VPAGLLALAAIVRKSQDRCVETEKRRYADSLDGKPGRPKGLPLTLIGYWKYEPAGDRIGYWESSYSLMPEVEGEPEWPRVTDFVDEDWDDSERDRVASYLEQGLVALAMCGHSACRFCGELNGCAENTDGVYLWPEGLAHYVRQHHVRPPVSVVRHIISRPATMQPQKSDDWWTTLHDNEGHYTEGVMPDWWWKARINMDWWKTATLDS
jgi:hypothetical protein